ncbi:MAG: hypothetical protein Q8Q75_12880 [Rhodoferax sp.]|nr:hypothetical protein [Rhodoferax sp.]
MIGQMRAFDAVRFGAGIRHDGFNILQQQLALAGSTRRTASTKGWLRGWPSWARCARCLPSRLKTRKKNRSK